MKRKVGNWSLVSTFEQSGIVEVVGFVEKAGWFVRQLMEKCTYGRECVQRKYVDKCGDYGHANITDDFAVSKDGTMVV